jgi:electron transfer flavoprotein beta subunit
MKIAVCLKEVIDTTLDLAYSRVADVQFQKGLSYRANPQDLLALAEALSLKAKDTGIEITLVSLGPARVEEYLREGLALGVDKAVRIWDDDFQFLSNYQKAGILARTLSLLKPDLVLAGARGLDNGSGVTGPLIAAWLEFPGICEVVGFHREVNGNIFTVTRNSSKRLQEKLLVILPAVFSIADTPVKLPYSSLENIFRER